MTLPCKHIFAVRKHFNQELFSKELRIDFQKSVSIQNQVEDHEVVNADNIENIAIISIVPKCKPKILYSYEKYTKSICFSFFDYGHVQFFKVFEKLKNIKICTDERILF